MKDLIFWILAVIDVLLIFVDVGLAAYLLFR